MTSTIITTQDWADFVNGDFELRDRPAEPGDIRFEIGEADEDGYSLVLSINDRGEIVGQDYTRDPHAIVEGFRHYQSMPTEEYLAPFGPAWQDEMEARYA